MIRNNICLSAHPAGCAAETLRQIEYVGARGGLYEGLGKPRAALVLGASGGYGLGSRIAASFGCGAATIGLSLERAPSGSKTGTPGWYNNRALDEAAARAGLLSESLDGDAFSSETKEEVIAAARRLGLRFDLVVYSLASPVRTDPATGVLYRSAIKPIGTPFRGRTVNVFTGALSDAEVTPATEEEMAATVKVMGGEDWELWIRALAEGGVLAEGCRTLAFSYIGPSLSWPLYRDGTLGRAKLDLDRAARAMTAAPSVPGLRAYVSVNKAVVTRASAVIPIIPLYVSVLFRVMKGRGTHEDCVAQMDRLFRDRLLAPKGRGLWSEPAVDEAGRIRMDDLELDPGIQAEVDAAMAHIADDNVERLADLEGFRADFLAAHGFGVAGVDYGAEA
jgi:enoyl-[acyl-carrier protein] reductase/trans-2-enoyl-CoA reductase (NAD+)